MTILRTPYRGRTFLREVKVDSAPAKEAIDFNKDARKYLRLGTAQLLEDVVLRAQVTGAITKVQKYLNQSFITQTLIAYYESVGKVVELPRGPVQSVTSVKRHYKDDTDTLTNDSDYFITGLDFKRIEIPVVYRSRVGHINYHYEIEYVAGYGDDPTDVPEEIKTAIWKQLAIEYERGEVSTALYKEVKNDLDLLRRG